MQHSYSYLVSYHLPTHSLAYGSLVPIRHSTVLLSPSSLREVPTLTHYSYSSRYVTRLLPGSPRYSYQDIGTRRFTTRDVRRG